MQKSIPLIVKSTFSDMPGTLIANIGKEDGSGSLVEDRIATGVTYLSNIAQIRVKFAANMSPEAGFQVFKTMSENSISVDLINVLPDQIMFTVGQDMMDKAKETLSALGFSVETVSDCAKVSVVGGGMREVPGVMAAFVEALALSRIAILQTVDSNASISVLIRQVNLTQAVQALHEKFALSQA
jgi:aspartate kinase